MLTIAGVELVTAADVADRWGDVRAARLRGWCQPTPHREPLLAAVTVAQLAALYGRPVPAGVDPHTPARIPGRHGPENLYEWGACVRADRLTRARTCGPSRRISRAA
jgi:hypothetical protein